MTARIPVSWRKPRREWLKPGGIYPSGEPPFDIFPTVNDIIVAYFCPRAILHRLFHGIDRNPALKEGKGEGDLYHRFIAFLKSSIVSRRLPKLDLGIIRQEFLRFGGEREDLVGIWDSYLEPWNRAPALSEGRNRLDELNRISPDERIFFEVTVASERVPFHCEGRRLTYPLRGVIDEIDLDRQLIIERTIRGGPEDQRPPELKELQLWLLGKILSSIEREKYPQELKEVNFNKFRLIIETPFHNFEIDKQNPRFEEEVPKKAYPWIQDLTRSSRSISQAYRNQRCDREPVECNFMYTVCRRRPFTYPRSRSRMRQEFRYWYRPLLWELIWNRDLFQYKLLRLSRDELEQEGLATRAQATSFPDLNTAELKIVKEEEIGPFLAHIRDANECELIFGTPSIGQRVGMILKESRDDKLIVEVDRKHIFMSGNTLILPNITLLESKPWFLVTHMQRDMFRFEHIGRDKPDTAKGDSLVQLIEGLFGSRAIKREA